MNNLSLDDDESQLAPSIELYSIKSTLSYIFKICLPSFNSIPSLINTKSSNLLSVNSQEFFNYCKANNKIDLSSIEDINSISILKNVCAFLGSINNENDMSKMCHLMNSTIKSPRYLENFKSFDSYILNNKEMILHNITLKTFNIFIKILFHLGITFPNRESNSLYKEMKNCIFSQDKICIIVSGAEMFWTRTKDTEINGVERDFKMYKHKEPNVYYNRSFLNKFLSTVVKHPRCSFAIINGLIPKNVCPFVNYLVETSTFPEKWKLLDQSSHIRLRGRPRDKSVVRDMKKIIHNININNDTTFDKTNIVILESDYDKIYNTLENSVKMILFTRNNFFYNEQQQQAYHKLEDAIILYILNLLNNCTYDVRQYIKDNPFIYEPIE